MVKTLIEHKSTELLYRQVLAAGKLPYGAFGKLYWVKQCNKMSFFAEKVRVYLQSSTQSIEVSLKLGDWKLSGWISKVQANGLLRWRPGNLSMKDGLLLLWLEHLAYCAVGGKGASRMFGTTGAWHFAPMHPNQATKFLLALIVGYYQG